MVLVSKEWVNNKDDEQFPLTETGTTSLSNSIENAETLRGALVTDNGVLSGPGQIQDQLVQTTNSNLSVDTKTNKISPSASERAVSGAIPAIRVSAEGRQCTSADGNPHHKRNKHMMDLKKSDDESLVDMAREKHEKETRDQQSNNIDGEMNNTFNVMQCKLEAENNNLAEYLERNVNTSACDSNTNTLQSPATRQMLTQQTLSMAVNSNLNSKSNNPTATVSTNNVFGSLSLTDLSNCALQQQQQQQINHHQQIQLHDVLTGNNRSMLLVSQSPTSEMENNSVITNGDAKMMLHCEPKSHKFEKRTITLPPNQECKVGRLIAKAKAADNNAIFDCKVLSRNHAIIWYAGDGHFWVKDTKSSNGTFINDAKLGNDPAELHFGDTVKFGVEVIENSRQEVHGCIIARVTLFLPDGREAITINQDEVQLTGPNRISFDEIHRLNGFMQEAAQREKMLKAKLSSLQNVLDSTRKSSAMCWQSMITEDQLLHKINLLEKKLQIMEKNVPENALRNEIVKLLEDKNSYQLTAKEALRKVYKERCEAMEMLTKMEMAYASSENECTILRTQISTSTQTFHEFTERMEKLQQEHKEYAQETALKQKEAKDLEEANEKQLREQLLAYERELEDLRLQVSLMQKTIDLNKEEQLQEEQALQNLDAVIAEIGLNVDDDDDVEEDDNDNHDAELPSMSLGQETGGAQPEVEDEFNKASFKKKTVKKKMGKKIQQDREQVVLLNLLKNSDLSKGEGGSDVLQAIINNTEADGDSGAEDQDICKLSAGTSSIGNATYKIDTNDSDTDEENEALANEEFLHSSAKHEYINGSSDIALNSKTSLSGNESERKLQTQETLVEDNDMELTKDQAEEMLVVECEMYKNKVHSLTLDLSQLQKQIEVLTQQKIEAEEELQATKPNKSSLNVESNSDNENGSSKTNIHSGSYNVTNTNQFDINKRTASMNIEFEREMVEDLSSMNNADVEREEELIAYKERLEKSECSNAELRNEISMLRLKQELAQPGRGGGFGLIFRALPLGCVALAIIYFYVFSPRGIF